MFGRRELTESDAEMVGIVEGIEEIFVERVDVLESWETLENGTEFLGESFLRKLDLSGVEGYFGSVKRIDIKNRVVGARKI